MTNTTGPWPTRVDRSTRRGSGSVCVTSSRRMPRASPAVSDGVRVPVRGYSRRRFEDAWARYLSPPLDSQNHPADPATDDNSLKDKDKPSPDEGASTRRRDGEHLATDEHSATGNGEGVSSDDDTSPDAEGPVGGCDEMHTRTDNQIKSKSSTTSPDAPDDLGGIGEKIKSDDDFDLMDEMFLRRPPPGEDTSPPKWEPL